MAEPVDPAVFLRSFLEESFESRFVNGGGNTAFEAGNVPSDLQGLLRIQYQTYQELCKKLYFGLPSFLASHKLI